MHPPSQRMAFGTLILVSLALFLIFAPHALGDDSLVAIHAWGDFYRPDVLLKIDPSTGELLALRDVTLDGTKFWGGFGLAKHPTTGELYGVVERYDQIRILVTIDPATGNATPVGTTGETGLQIVGLSFALDGTLYAVTGKAKYLETEHPNALFTLDVSTDPITPTKVCDLADRGSTHSIAFNPTDGLLYHTSGGQNSPQVFESIDVANPDVSCAEPAPITLTGDTIGDMIISLSYVGSNTFLATDWNYGLYTITASGVVTKMLIDGEQPLDFGVKGMAWTSESLPLRDVGVSTSFSPASVPPGGSTTLTITVTNGDVSDATGVRTSMYRSSYLTLTGQSGDATCSETTSPNLITCDFGTLAGSTSEAVDLVFTTSDLATGAYASNYVRTDAWATALTSWWAVSYVQFLGTDLALSVTPPKQPASKGKESTFTFTVSNLGPYDSTVVSMDTWTDPSYSGAFVSASGANCTVWDASSGYAECELGSLPSGQSKSFSITYLCNLGGKRTFTVGGYVWSDRDPVKSNNEAYASVKTVGKH